MSAVFPDEGTDAAVFTVGDFQYQRRYSLILTAGSVALGPNFGAAPNGPVQPRIMDLSAQHLIFETSQEDAESPNNCSIRVHNLSKATVDAIRKEYTDVTLQAGYKNGPMGIIFQGNIKQFRVGREDNKTTYLDILAADGDLAYNSAVVNATLAAGSSFRSRINAISKEMAKLGVTEGQIIYPNAGGTLPRGKVLFGYAKAAMRSVVQSMNSTWNINNGQINVIPLTGYLPGEAVVLTSATGLIGRPEQTIDGIRARCLLNPKITIGGTVRIDNASINRTEQQKDAAILGAQVPYNQWAGLQQFASIAADGLYRVYVAEHRGDTRGQTWYTDITCLTVNPDTQTCAAYGWGGSSSNGPS